MEETFGSLNRSREFASYLAKIATMCGEQNWPTWGVAWARQKLMELWIAVHRGNQTLYFHHAVVLEEAFPPDSMALDYGGSTQLWALLLEPLDTEDFWLWDPVNQLHLQKTLVQTGTLLSNLQEGTYGETPPSNIMRGGKYLSLIHI